MVVVDEVKQRPKFMTLSWTEFLEALGRMAEMMTLPTRDEAVAYIMAHGLQDLLTRAANACVKADATDPVDFLIERLQAIKDEEGYGSAAQSQQASDLTTIGSTSSSSSTLKPSFASCRIRLRLCFT